ncbi:MAG: hypothetical protein A2W31_10590 [Planctomycetes bacterium RBG_16_64_10]|nr:MAG: hypothetical protein A2W31_10590 [Planctomycetes bacterium RBG_16_64_10]
MAQGLASDGSPIEQAIYTSAQTDRGGGYQVVAASPGLVDRDLRALATWCPSHDALLEAQDRATSINFHPLPSGAFCIARTETAGAEYSERGGRRLHTHCLITPPHVLQRFGNNPFALLRAAVAGGLLERQEPAGRPLPAARLPGRAALFDHSLLAWLGRELGSERLNSLLDSALTARLLGLAAPRAERIVAGLLNCLPIEVRTEFSFSTGLRFSPRRPFRWVVVERDEVAQRHLEQQFDVTVVNPHRGRPRAAAPAEHGWARFVAACLDQRRLAQLKAELSRPRPGLTTADLSALGKTCLSEGTVTQRPTAATNMARN